MPYLALAYAAFFTLLLGYAARLALLERRLKRERARYENGESGR